VRGLNKLFKISRYSALWAAGLLGGVLAITLSVLGGPSTHASDVYISQNASGGANGADCANAYAVSFFNNSGNWGGGSIGASTTVHLCGTFSGAVNTTLLTFQGSGTSGNPITLKFESGAVLTSPAWSANGAINIGNNNYLVIDGGTNGIIQNTSNGTPGEPSCLGGPCSVTQESRGIYALDGSGEHDIEIKNLHIQDIFVRTAGDAGTVGSTSNGIAIGNAGNNLLIHDNYVSHSFGNIEADSANGTVTGWRIYNNTTYEANWNINVATRGSGSTLNGLQVYGNDVSYAERWQNQDVNHHDGIFIFNGTSGESMTGVYVYNNYVHGDLGAALSAYIYLDNADSGSTMTNGYVFNNVFDGTAAPNPACCGMLYLFGVTNAYVYNNTFAGNGGTQAGGAISSQAGCSNVNFQNNVLQNLNGGLVFLDTTTLGTVNDNVYYNIVLTSGSFFNLHGTWYQTLAAWQAQRYDTASSSSNPNLGHGFVPQSGSPATSLGANLTSAGIAALDSDKAGNQRPASGNWTVGAYQFGASAASRPAPPTGVVVTVH
jgi:hypothetical protein